MTSKVDWRALEAVFAASAPKVPSVSREDALTGYYAALDAWDAAEERAAIMEYDGGMDRSKAETLAFAGVKGVCWWVTAIPPPVQVFRTLNIPENSCCL